LLSTLWRLHRTELRNRLRAGGRTALVLLSAVAAAAALGAALVLVGARVVAAGPADPRAFADALFERSFWLNALLAFVMGFTTFELLFRSEAGQRLEALPVAGDALFADRLLALVALHLPLLVGALLFAAPLWPRDPALFAYAALVHGATWLVCLGVGTWLHVLAGRSLLGGSSVARDFLGGGYQLNESAFLLYSPGATFAFALFAAIPVGLFARPLALGGPPGLPLGTLAAVVALCGLALARAARVYGRGWRFIRARFTEAEILPPWREHDLPRRVPGAFAERWLPPPLRGLYHKDLLQLRRRHRIDLLLLLVAAIGVVLFHLRTAQSGVVLFYWDGALLLLGVGALLTPVYKLAGDELEPPGFLRALPAPLEDVRLAKLLVALTHQAPLATWRRSGTCSPRRRCSWAAWARAWLSRGSSCACRSRRGAAARGWGGRSARPWRPARCCCRTWHSDGSSG
jgi:hypothetical protein